MCGRYSLGKTDRMDWRDFGVAPIPNLVPRWNIAPGTDVLVIREGTNGRESAMLRWGFIPAWSKDPAIGHRLANARSESAHEKPSFRAAFKSRRCLLPADGFYEWQAVTGEKRKQPWRIEARGGDIVALAGLWEAWGDAEGDRRETCTILTVDANAALAHIHSRMPVVIAPADVSRWLSGDTAVRDATALCTPAPNERVDAWRISLAINDPTRNDESVAARLSA